MEQNLKFYLTLVCQEDAQTGDFTVFFAQFPEASAQGRTREEAELLLEQIFPYVLADKRDEFIKYHQNSETAYQVIDKPMQASA